MTRVPFLTVVFVSPGPEYRLHAMVFLLRSLGLMTLYYYEEVNHLEPNYDINFAIVMAQLVGAGLSSWSQGDNASGTIGDLGVHPAVRFLFSHMQFGAISACLYGIRRYSIVFYMAFILQLNPFIMTLRRKNITSKRFLLVVYSLMLAMGVATVDYEIRFLGAPQSYHSRVYQDLITHSATLLRLGPRLPVLKYIQNNKYLMWLLLGFCMRQMRPFFDRAGEEGLPSEIIFVRHVLMALCLALFVWKGFLVDKLRVDVVTTKKTV